MARRDVRDDTALVAAVRDGDRDAFGILFERWFDRVYDVARNIVRSPETAADVAQDTFVTVWERLGSLDRPEAFGGWLLRIARNRALDRLEREGRSTSQDTDVVTGLHDRGTPDLVGSRRELDVEEISASRDRDALVQAAAVALGERDASLLDLQLRHGLTPAEIADELGVTPNNAHQLLFRMRAKLGDAVGAVVLWRRGNPACPELATLLAGAGNTFDRSTFDLVERHRKQCDMCADRRAALLAPEQLFSAAPILVAPALLKSGVVERLGGLGVPVAQPTPAIDGATPADGTTPTDATTGADPSGTPDPAAPASPSSAIPGVDGDGSGTTGLTAATSSRTVAATDAKPIDELATHELATDDVTDRKIDDDERRGRRGVLLLIAASILVVAGIAGTAVVASRSGGSDGDTDLASPAVVAPSTPAPTTTRADDALTAPTEVPRQRSATTAPALVVDPGVTTVPVDTTAPATTTIAAVLPTLPPPAGPPTSRRPPTTPAPPTIPPTVPPAAEPPPVVPETTAPPAPPTTPAPSPTTVPPPPPPPPPPPEVVRFYFGTVPAGLLCADPAQIPRRFLWTSTGTTTGAQLVVAGIPRNVPATGGLNTCAASGDVATITVSGPGGSDTANLPVP